MREPLFERVALVGLGLIGASIALAARREGLAGEIVGYARSEATRARARELGLCDHVADTLVETAAGADLVMLCIPVGAYARIVTEISPVLSPGCVLSDVGSVKTAVVADVGPLVPDGVAFVPGHPLAGTEHSGPDAGFAELFEDRWCILTPVATDDGGEVDAEAVAKVRLFWHSMGAEVAEMTPEHHDLVLAVTSHVPHAIAYTMVGVADDLARVTDSEVVRYSAAGFRDFTRIAASDPTMWRDVFLANKDATLDILGRFTEELFQLRRAIRTGDGDYLHAYFTRTRAIRRGIIEAGQDTEAPDFGRLASRRARE